MGGLVRGGFPVHNALQQEPSLAGRTPFSRRGVVKQVSGGGRANSGSGWEGTRVTRARWGAPAPVGVGLWAPFAGFPRDWDATSSVASDVTYGARPSPGAQLHPTHPGGTWAFRARAPSPGRGRTSCRPCLCATCCAIAVGHSTKRGRPRPLARPQSAAAPSMRLLGILGTGRSRSRARRPSHAAVQQRGTPSMVGSWLACFWLVLCDRLGATALWRPGKPRERGGHDTASRVRRLGRRVFFFLISPRTWGVCTWAPLRRYVFRPIFSPSAASGIFFTGVSFGEGAVRSPVSVSWEEQAVRSAFSLAAMDAPFGGSAGREPPQGVLKRVSGCHGQGGGEGWGGGGGTA